MSFGEANDLEEGTCQETQPPIPSGKEEESSEDLEAILQSRNFIQEQRNDPTLSHAYEQLASINDEVTEPQRGKQYLHFAFKKQCLYWIERSTNQDVRAQLLVPHMYLWAVLQLVHDIPCTGHLERKKTVY